MTQSNDTTNTENIQETQTTQVKEPTVTPDEEQALAAGWVPKDEWVEQGRPAEEWRSAKEFNERGELFRSIHQIKRELRQKDAALTALQRHHQYVFEKAHQTALAELKREKRQAMRDDDMARVAELDEKIDDLQVQTENERKVLTQQTQVNTNQGPHPDFVAWVERNTWYSTDTELQELADGLGMAYASKHPGIQPQAVLQYVETTIKKQFPDKFGNKRAAPSAVVGADKTIKRIVNTTDIELDDLEREIMRQLVSSGEMTEKQYKDELKRAKGIK